MTQPLSDLGAMRRRCCMAGLLAAAPRAYGSGRTLSVGPGERWRTLQDAVRAAGSGDTIELQPAEYPGDVAVVAQPQLTIRGLGRGAVLRAEGRDAEGKAILVVRGEGVVLENLEFRGARVLSGNGAGVRFERGRLSVRRCRFFDNEMGLLTANEADMELEVVDCEFGAAPRHEGLLHHLLYVGTIGSFALTGSRLGQGWRGHLVKSRARRNRIEYSRLDDGPDGEASYELEFPNGGHNVVLGNVIVQSARTQNPAMLSMGAEAGLGGLGSDGSLWLAHNTLVNDAGDGGRFVHIWSERLPAEMRVQMVNNLFVGPGQLMLPPEYDGGGNHRIGHAELRDPARGDFRLLAGSPLSSRAVALPAALTPRFQPARPVGKVPLSAGGRLSCGALHDEKQ